MSIRDVERLKDRCKSGGDGGPVFRSESLPGVQAEAAELTWMRSVLVAQSCLTLCDPMCYNPPGSSVHGTLQAKIQEWVAMPFSRGSSRPRDQTRVSCTAGRFFTIWASREAPGDLLPSLVVLGRLSTQRTPANQLQLGPFSPTIAKPSGRSIECNDRPFLLKEGASYFQRNGPYFWGTPFCLHPHGNREHTDRFCPQLCNLRFTEPLAGQLFRTAFHFCVLFPSWPSKTS